MKTLKNALHILAMLAMMLISSSCAYDMYQYDSTVYVTGTQVTTIVSFGNPYYVGGRLRYYYYNGYYWYPYRYGGATYLYRRTMPYTYYNHYRHVPSTTNRHSSATRAKTPNARPQSPQQSTSRSQSNLRPPSKPSHVIRQTQPSTRSRQVAQPSRSR